MLDQIEAKDLDPGATASIDKPNDSWKCGHYRLMCEDATSVKEHLMGRTANVVFNDPPYHSKIDGFVSGLGMEKTSQVRDGLTRNATRAISELLANFIVA